MRGMNPRIVPWWIQFAYCDADRHDARMTSVRFALGTFAAGDGREFGALVIGDAAWELEPRLGSGVRGLLDDWAASLPRLQELADSLDGSAGDQDVQSL